MDNYTGVSTCIYFFALSAEGPKSNDTPVARNTPESNLVSNTILQLKEPRLLGEMVDPRTGAGNIHDEPGAPSSARKKVL